eukprot:424332_1
MSAHFGKKYDVRTQRLVFGYIRGSQSLLRNDSVYYMIPDLITYTIMAHYHSIEYFKYYSPNNITVSEDGFCITKSSEYSHHTCYGSIVIPFDSHGTHKWTLSMTRLGGGGTIIGVTEANPMTLLDVGCNFTSSEGDSICVILDMDTKTISFAKNNCKALKACDVMNTAFGYCLALWICDEDDCITLQSYEYSD